MPRAKTYVFIDVSNIRETCLRSCGFLIDFERLYQYFQNKYSGLTEVRYYEGLASNNEEKRLYIEHLRNDIGYVTRILTRKLYTVPAHCYNYQCRKCGHLNRECVIRQQLKMKANVDVYLAAEMIEQVAKNQEPIHIIVMTADGDYVEAFQAALRVNPNSSITVIAPPKTKVNNCLSKRLRQLSAQLDREHYNLVDISTIQDRIKADQTPVIYGPEQLAVSA